MRKLHGIYIITNLITGQIYVGSTYSLGIRKSQHFSNLRKNRHCNKYLQNSFNKYGEENFVFDVVQIVDKIEDLIFYEQKWINLTRCYIKEFGYNLCEIADRPSVNQVFSKESRRKQAEAISGEKHYAYNKGFSKKHKENLSLAHVGLPSNRAIKVDQYSLNNEFIKSWNSAREAALDLGISPSNMWKVLNNERKKCGGYKWKYKLKDE